MSRKSSKISQKTANNRQNVDLLTICSEIRRIAKIFFCLFAQIPQKKYVIIAKKRKIYENPIDILEI